MVETGNLTAVGRLVNIVELELRTKRGAFHEAYILLTLYGQRVVINLRDKNKRDAPSFKYEVQTALFKDPVRTAQ